MPTINTTPDSQDLWDGIGGHFDSLTQVLEEFVDNSAANFVGKNPAIKQVSINLREVGSDQVYVSVEDTGTGIADLQVALRLGDRSLQDSPLSAHGFGVKHALATADPRNENWMIAARTAEERESGVFRAVRAPYSFSIEVYEEPTEAWPGEHNGSGTFVEFTCSRDLFDTISKGIPGAPGFQRTVDYLIEDLGYTYSNIITSGRLQITVTDGARSMPVAAVTPIWVDMYPPGRGSVVKNFTALDGHPVTVDYEFGEMADREIGVRYYRRNIRSAGVEIRLNGRAITRGLFSEIWPREKHPDYNHFLARINLVAEDKKLLPRTRSSKTGFREGDPVLGELFEWIRTVMSDPPRELTSGVAEGDLVEKLRAITDSVLEADDKVVTREKRVYSTTGHPPKADLYVYDGHHVSVYEAKKDVADVQALYQLLMYWDGLVRDGVQPAKGLLIATSFSPGVDQIMEWLNNRQDGIGNHYHFETTT